jgi:hypothetical protein
VKSFLPEGWEEKARDSGAFQRQREVRSPEDLLRILLIHVGVGYSLKESALRADILGLGKLSSVCLHNRLKSSEEWLRWLAEELWRERGRKLVGPGRRIRAVDATVVSEPGSTGTDWRLHYAVNLHNLQCDFFELTDARGGETWRRVPVEEGDILIGDRGYAHAEGIASVLKGKADVIVRMNHTNLPLWSGAGQRLNLLQETRGLKVLQMREREAWVRDGSGNPWKGRLLVLRKSRESARLAMEKLIKTARKKQKRVALRRLRAAFYIFVWTSLEKEWTTLQVLEWYRMRWQIELVFKRMKSLLGLGHLPKKDPHTARGWLHGKIFVSLLVECLLAEAKAFSPWGYRLPHKPQPVA